MTVLEIALIIVVTVESIALVTVATVKIASCAINRRDKLMQLSLDMSLLRDDFKTVAKSVLDVERRVTEVENELIGGDEEP